MFAIVRDNNEPEILPLNATQENAVVAFGQACALYPNSETIGLYTIVVEHCRYVEGQRLALYQRTGILGPGSVVEGG